MGVLHVEITDQLHRDAKAAAAQRGETLRALVVRAIERETARVKAEEGKRRSR